MRRTALAAGLLLLTACGANPTAATGSGAPTVAPEPTSTTAHPTHLFLRVLPQHLPGPIAREAVITTPAGTIVAGGLLDGDASSATAYLLTAGGGVRRMPALPVPVHDTAGALLAGRPLVIGGGNASEQDVVQEWDGHRWSVVGHLPQARSDLVAATVGGRVLVLGGYDGSRPAEPGILASSDGRRWRTIGRLPVPVRYPASTVLGGAVWLFGGERSGSEQRAIQRVDPRTGAARVVSELPIGLGHAVAVALGGRVLVVGGRTGPDTLSARQWWFDPGTGRVTPAGRLSRPLADAAVARLGAHTVVVGGESPADTDHLVELTLR
ncbi:MAG TPA: hypothetical protein VJ872_20205 [Nocardioides sp.]|nr:hypothetical protein [Nocardioides sp.]